MSKWVSVDESLPPYGVIVGLARKSAKPSFGTRSHTDRFGEHWKGQYDPTRDSDELDGVTHWFPLPDYP
jgi:hypothetical protein